MEGKRFKVRVIKKTKNESFNTVLPYGFETETVNILHDEEKIVDVPIYEVDKKGLAKKLVEIKKHLVHSKGDLKDITFTGANGQVYGSDFITRTLGYIPISEIFEKIK